MVYERSQSDNNQESVDEFESKLLELWDRIYQFWLTKQDQFNENLKDIPGPVHQGPKVSQEALTSSMEAMNFCQLEV